jgi:hypothetical protein
VIRTSDLERFISDFEERLAPVERAADEAWWNLATSGTNEAREEFVAAGKAYSDLFSDTDEYRKLRDLFENLDSVDSLLLRRRIEVLYRMFEERQGDEETLGRIEELEAEANAIYGNHRSVVGGEKDLASAPDAPFRILKGDLDAELRRKFGVEEVMPWHLSGACLPRGHARVPVRPHRAEHAWYARPPRPASRQTRLPLACSGPR